MSDKFNVDKEKAIRILEYWFLVEILNQESFDKFKEKEKKATSYKEKLSAGSIRKPNKVVEDFEQITIGENLQTLLNSLPKQLKSFQTSDFTVFIGCMRRETCIQEIARNIQWSSESPDAKEPKKDEISLAVLKFSKDGRYVSNSLSISPLAWAMTKLQDGVENTSQKLSIDNYYSVTKTIETQISDLLTSSENDSLISEEIDTIQSLNTVSYDLLIEVENMICKELNLKGKDITSYCAAYFKLFESEKSDEGGNEETLHMDFFSKDLALVIDGLRNNRFSKEKEKVILDYILGINRYDEDHKKPSNRFDIIKPKDEEELYGFIANNLTVAKAPLGKWPSRFMPVLMQQIAINLASDPNINLPIFSVNGPPGTGKTTLLKEIIVNNIVEKARLLAEYDEPDDAFDDFAFSHGDDQDNSYNQFYKKYHRLKNKKINAYSILVASSNNTAVENITKELPIERDLLKNIDPSKEEEGPNNEALAELTNLFTVSESPQELPYMKMVWRGSTNEKGVKKKKCKMVVEKQPDIYFSRLATDLLNADVQNKDHKEIQAFGLISASLGKKDNIDKVNKNVITPLLDIIGANKDIEPRKEYYLEVRKKFLTQLKLVRELCKELDKLGDEEKAVAEAYRKVEEKEQLIEKWRKNQHLLIDEIDDKEQVLQNRIIQFNAEKDRLAAEITIVHTTCEAVEAKIKSQYDNIATISKRIEKTQNSVSIFGKFFNSEKYRNAQMNVAQAYEEQTYCQQQVEELDKKLDKEKKKSNSLQEEIDNLTAEISNSNKELKQLQSRREKIRAEGNRLERELVDVKEKAKTQKSLLEKEKENHQKKDSYDRGFILDRQFISDILSKDQDISTKAQLRNPWFSEHYNREREKLFLYALQMTKEFVLSSKKCRNNFQHLYCLWNGNYYTTIENRIKFKKCREENRQVKFIGDDLQNCTAAAYETLFLLIPVISSTFASIQRLFRNVTEEDFIGTLIVDEAGQASPHMVIGALSRSRKAVIVGDPKQVEPVVTDDQDLLKQIYTDDFFEPYKDKTNSVQRFADIINPYGTYLKNAQGIEEWVGCPLLVHRRCISPMYEISNDISYNNIMKQQTAQPDTETQKLFIAGKSQWFNVGGKEEGVKRHFVKEQGEKVIKMLEVAFSKDFSKNLADPTPDLFIISPFETVESGIIDYVKKYVSDCKRNGVESFLVKNEDALKDWIGRKVGTVHKFQGKEAAEVIFLLGCDTSEDAKPAIRWVKNNIVNVAATRAKYRFYVIGDIQAWRKSKCVKRAKKILDSYVSGSLGWKPKNYDPNGGYTLIITEKPSVAETYAKALCVWNEPTDDFYEGNGYLISWCLGHLFELADPGDYNEKYKNWNLEDLPIIPENWKYKIREERNSDKQKNNNETEKLRHRFEVLKTLMNRDDVTEILCATDAGREGELIFRLVYQQTGSKKPFRRIWLSSMEADSIRNEFENPRPSSDYDSLYESARCRELADWIVGMNASRFYTCRYKKKVNELGKKTLSVGRVVSPTLAMIVDRENEIKSFVHRSYYTLNLNVGGVIFESRRFETEDDAIRIMKEVTKS